MRETLSEPGEGGESGPTRKGHALFPRAPGSGPETRDIAFVQIQRINDRGVSEHAARDFPADELPNMESVVELFGGGDYRFAAKNTDHQITAWFPPAGATPIHIEGRSKPFRTVATYEQGPALAPPPAAAPAPSPPAVDLAALLIASQERADRLLHELFAAWRTPAPAPVAAPALSGVAQLAELAGVLKMLQGGSGGGGSLRQLAETVDVLDKIRGPVAAAAAPDDLGQITQLFTQFTTFAGKDTADDDKPAKKSAAAATPAGHLVWIEGLGWVVRPADQPPPPAQRPAALAAPSAPAPPPVAAPAPTVAASPAPGAASAAPPPVAAPAPAATASLAPGATAAAPAPVAVPAPAVAAHQIDELAAAFVADPAFRDAFLARVNQSIPPAEAPAPSPPAPEAPASSSRTPRAAPALEAPATSSRTPRAAPALEELPEAGATRAACAEFEADPEVQQALPAPLLAIVKQGLGAAA